MSSELTTNEWYAISKLRKALSELPGTIRLYVTDGGFIYICKEGIPTEDICESIFCNINSGAMLDDMHDY